MRISDWSSDVCSSDLMLTGDETGWLLCDYLLSLRNDPSSALVASTVVSSRMLAAIAAGYGAQHAETLTGFKWLARATAPGAALIYAYEEAKIGRAHV